MAKKTSKKSQRKKPAGRSASAARGKKKTTGKKTTARKSTRKKSAAPKKAPAKKKKKTPGKKTAAKKKTSGKKTAAKKKTSGKKTAAKKKTGKKKTAGKKKTTTKKTTTKKPTKKKTGKVGKTPTAKSAVESKKKKKKTKATTTKKRSGRRSLGARSVAEAASAGEADAQGYVYVNGRRVRMISTKNQNPARKTRVASTAKEAEAKPEGPKKPVKTSLTAKQLRHYREVLLVKRAELVGDVSAMETAALQPGGGNLSNLPIHMADIGSDTYDQDFMLSLAETERKRLHEIDDALKRIVDKTYGVCQMTGEPIPTARLDAKPWAKYTIEAARALEREAWRP